MEDHAVQNKMGTAPVSKLLLTMGLPIVVSMVVQAFYNIVDSYFVSKMTDDVILGIGEYGINALSIAFPIQLLMIAFGVGTGVGINALLSRSLGEGDKTRASKIAGNAIFLGVCTYIAFFLFGLFGVDYYLESQTSDVIVRKKSSPYPHTMVFTLVNGGAKYMADATSYDCITYEAMNSGFGRGAAEILEKEAQKILTEICGIEKEGLK